MIFFCEFENIVDDGNLFVIIRVGLGHTVIDL